MKFALPRSCGPTEQIYELSGVAYQIQGSLSNSDVILTSNSCPRRQRTCFYLHTHILKTNKAIYFSMFHVNIFQLNVKALMGRVIGIYMHKRDREENQGGDGRGQGTGNRLPTFPEMMK